MTSPENTELRQVIGRVLTREGLSEDALPVKAAVQRAYDELGSILIPLIGQLGVEALTTRSLRLAQRECPSGRGVDGEPEGPPINQVMDWLERQDPTLAADAATAMLSTLGMLLMAFIGEPLTMRILRKSWPDGFPNVRSEETAT